MNISKRIEYWRRREVEAFARHDSQEMQVCQTVATLLIDAQRQLADIENAAFSAIAERWRTRRGGRPQHPGPVSPVLELESD